MSILIAAATVFGLLCAAVVHAQSRSGSSNSTTLYRWVDANGVVHFSDSPRPGSDDPSRYEYSVRTPNVSRAQPRRSSTPSPSSESTKKAADDAKTPAGYQALTIIAPSSGDTLWNTGGTLNVGVQVSPALQQGHGIMIFIDGQPKTPTPVQSTNIALSNVYRGAHTLIAAVRDQQGNQYIASQPVQFVVQQTTVN